MLNVNQLIDIDRLGQQMILTDVEPYYEYVDNMRTDHVAGYKYTVVLPECNYEKLNVKIAGNQQINFDGDLVNVQFVGLQIRAYSMASQKNVYLSAKADGIQAI